MRQTQNHIKEYLSEDRIHEHHPYSVLKLFELYTRQEIVTYTTLNKLVAKGSLEVGFFFSYLSPEKLNAMIADLRRETHFQVRCITSQCLLDPPTKIMTNEFMAAFQSIVDTYGVPGPKEVNPAIFAIITFPFLFGVMFGDICHGFLLFCVGAALCLMREKIESSGSMFKALLPARYLVLLMGFFACYCGFMYNDFASLPIEFLQGSCYSENSDRAAKDCVYSFGVDHRWYRSKNEITFVNSLKMKLSVIFGVA